MHNLSIDTKRRGEFYMATDAADALANRLRNMALSPDCDGEDFETLHDAAYVVEAARGAIGYLRNAKIDLETGAPKATAVRTIDGGIAMLEKTFAETVSA
jgi:hypothetical protein